jgi:type I restriction enzyme S subunit
VQPGENNPGGVPFVQSRDVGGQIDLNALQRTATAIAAQYRRSMIAEGDILFHCAEPSGSRR